MKRLKDELLDSLIEHRRRRRNTWTVATPESILEAIAPVIDQHIDRIVEDMKQTDQATDKAHFGYWGMWDAIEMMKNYKIGPLP
jgi:hypothetical protein